MASYHRPATLPEALALMAAGRRVVVAGGTDHYPARVGRAADEDVLDVTRIPDLKGVARTEAGYRIGAAVTWTEIAQAALPPAFDGLRRAAREVGGIQVQNRATIGGNLCNASPAADGVPPLLALDAEVELAGAAGMRRLPLERFVLGNRRTARAPDQIMVAIHVPCGVGRGRSTFLKLGARRYLVISIAMVAVVIEAAGEGTVARARVAIGACSEVATRLRALEADLAGRPLKALGAVVTPEHLAPLNPIDDVRASAGYRRDAALVLVRRALAEVAP
jgi:CO/xanthine dehydrogenase FAD-binding subunit